MDTNERQKVHVAMFSGGAGSAYVAHHMVQTYGKENCILFFTNTLWEDEDNYRFMDEVSKYIGLEITERLDGRTPEEVFYDERFLGNARLAKCSEELKVRQTIIFLEEELRNQKKTEPILYFGIGPHEKHRADNLKEFYSHFPLEPIETRFPLIELFREDLDAKGIIKDEWGIELPRMYNIADQLAEDPSNENAKILVKNKVKGFSHANCAGRCVRGGFQHYAILYAIWPERYREQEEMEERFRKAFKKDVSILKKNGAPYTMKQFREVMEAEGFEKFLFKEDADIPCVCSFS
ncbi:hypothetical protein O0555_11940 [Brevibacillus laterosporus]|uniref:hypothetical protein n=1 Tax=Brevibacillus laterosporus TaxID=1465 RepID=UPI0018CF257F|nr:hypothetical protein [Brevibacillus laterosporus]MCR8938059.1 hypothetical protein [Brevibacillus laterosporus]MCZ0840699.1 hypothetical protein [Brevibacillus laterosporus]MCZ0847706.1 hypothetical protein [Brevibacillus laterosporus]MED1911369.1 hypothetical protein [Brevibacillus laterosporus]